MLVLYPLAAVLQGTEALLPAAATARPVEIGVEFLAKPADAFAETRVVSIEDLPKLWMVERRNVDDDTVFPVSAYGRFLENIGDVDGRGGDDLLVGSWQFEWDERIDLIHGETASTVFAPGEGAPKSYIAEGFRGAAALGDINRDGQLDFGNVAYDDSLFLNRAQLRVSHKALRQVIEIRVDWNVRLGSALAPLRGEHADLDADGWNDVLVSSHEVDSLAAAFLYSSQTGEFLGTLRRESTANALESRAVSTGLPPTMLLETSAETNTAWIAISSPIEAGQRGCVSVWSEDSSLRLLLEGTHEFGYFGREIAWAGENLLAISSPWAGSNRQGHVRVYDVRDSSLVRAWSGERGDSCFGLGLDASRDLDGDGVIDFVVGAPGYVQSYTSPSAVYVLSGASGMVLLRIDAPMTVREPWPEVYWLSCESSYPLNFRDPISDAFGWAVATGDFDGDGLADLAIGSPQRGPNNCVGKVYAVSGAALRELMRSREPEKVK